MTRVNMNAVYFGVTIFISAIVVALAEVMIEFLALCP